MSTALLFLFSSFKTFFPQHLSSQTLKLPKFLPCLLLYKTLQKTRSTFVFDVKVTDELPNNTRCPTTTDKAQRIRCYEYLSFLLDQSVCTATADLYTAVSASAANVSLSWSAACRRCARGFSYQSSLLVTRCRKYSRNEQYSQSEIFFYLRILFTLPQFDTCIHLALFNSQSNLSTSLQCHSDDRRYYFLLLSSTLSRTIFHVLFYFTHSSHLSI